MIRVPVCLIGCGPIGLTGALLLSRFGIKTLLVERRGQLNTHPRSRFVDTNTMELMRELGVEKEVEDTGLGPDWTQCNRWAESLTGHKIASIPSPTFHTVPRDTSPCLPVMTCQDYVENVLLEQVLKDPNIDVRFDTQASDLVQDENETRLTITNRTTGEAEDVVADYTIGSDGPASSTREVIGCELESAPLQINFQDVIFDADLSDYVEGWKGALLYNATKDGILIFQPLNGVRRWRCQIGLPDDKLISEEAAINRIRLAIGAEDVPITVSSTSIWQPTPGCVTHFSKGRIFVAGDAAHITVPTGGMGNNIGFAGIRNLAWKLAYVIKGLAPESILETYDIEHRPLSELRIAVGVDTTRRMAPIFQNYYAGNMEGASEAATHVYQYGDYDGVLLGFELASDLIAKEDTPPPAVDNWILQFVPAIRSGRRAPHIWADGEKKVSVLDWFGTDYVLIAGAKADTAGWQAAVDEISGTGFPIQLQQLTVSGDGTAPYAEDGVVLVRPDGVIAGHWEEASVSADQANACLTAHLPKIPEMA